MHALSFSGVRPQNARADQAVKFSAISTDDMEFETRLQKAVQGNQPPFSMRTPWEEIKDRKEILAAMLTKAQKNYQNLSNNPEILNDWVQDVLRYHREMFFEKDSLQEIRKTVLDEARQFGGAQDFYRALKLISKSFQDQLVPPVIMDALKTAYEQALGKASKRTRQESNVIKLPAAA